MASVCASEAFYKQLKGLLVTDFPCGLGSWRPNGLNSNNNFNPQFDSGSVQCENITDLLELENSGPYAVDCSWSKEAKTLRKIAVESPESLSDPNFVLKHFRTLKIVDKNVCSIDDGLLKFINLKELCLAANLIEELDGRNFPSCLEVLELAANNIKSLAGFKGDNPKSLLHLGLAHNQVSTIPSWALAPSRWPSLLSLDLSYNNLDDLQATVTTLKDLSTLRSLLLVGNPLYLSKCYHGFIIDSIPGLSFLDDTEVSADDRHQYKSFARMKDLNVNKSQITVEVVSLNNVKKPCELEEMESAPEYPKLEFKYHVEFAFLNDDRSSEPPNAEELTPDSSQEEFSAATGNALNDQVGPPLFTTDKLPWAEALELNFNKTLSVTELTDLRSFLQSGVTFTAVGVKHSYVLEDPQLSTDDGNSEDCRRGSTADKQGGKNAKENTKSAGKKGDNKTGAKEKGGKKDKRTMDDLFELPQEARIVGSYHVTLARFLEGEDCVRVCAPCVQEGGEANDENGAECATNDELKDASKLQSDKKKSKDAEKAQKAAQGKTKSKDAGKPGGAGAVAKGAKNGKGKDKVDDHHDEAEDEIPALPPPLAITFEIRLNRWKNTKDVLHENKN